VVTRIAGVAAMVAMKSLWCMAKKDGGRKKRKAEGASGSRRHYMQASRMEMPKRGSRAINKIKQSGAIHMRHLLRGVSNHKTSMASLCWWRLLGI